MAVTGKDNQAPEGPAKVTVVNSDADSGEVVARVLEAEGHDVVRAFDQAPSITPVISDPPALVVLDVDGDASNRGVGLLEELRQHQAPEVRDVRVVLIGTQPGSEVLAWGAGADGFLDRPVRADDLARLVADALARPDDERADFRAKAHEEARRG